MINLALVGAGVWGKNYLSTIRFFPNARIKYICSQSEASLGTIDGDYIKTTDYLDLLDKQDISGVIIATPSVTHYKIAKAFLERGFNILIEKPLALQYRQAKELKEIAEKTKLKVLVGHVYLFDPAYQALKSLIPELGNLESIHFQGLNNSPENNLPVLWEYGPHPISLCLDLTLKEITKLEARGSDELEGNPGVFRTVSINLKYIDGVEAFIKLSWLTQSKKRELLVVGSKGELRYSDLENPKIFLKKKKLNENHLFYPKYADIKPLEAELRYFIESISKDKKIRISGIESAVEVIRLLALADKSIRSNGKMVNVS